MKRFINCIFGKAPELCVSMFSIFIFGTLLLNVILDNRVLQNPIKIYDEIPNIILIFFSLALVILAVFLIKFPLKLKKITDKQFVLVIALCFVAVFGLQLFLISNIWFRTDWDVATLVNDAQNIAYNNVNTVTQWYYSTYPNNLVLVYILAFILKIGKIILPEPYFAVLGINALAVCLSVFLAVLCIFKITKSRKVTVVGMLMGVCLIALSPWIVIPYSDTLGMFFPIFSVFAYLYIKNTPLRYLLCALSACLGFLIKPTVIIVLIAICIVELCKIIVSLTKRKFQYKRVIALVLAVVTSFCCAEGIKELVNHIDKTDFNESMEFSMQHFFMMGTNTRANGGYATEDVSFSYSFVSAEARKRGNFDVAISRIKEMGPVGYAKHLIRKNISNYNNGTFNWGKEGSFFAVTFEKEGKIPRALQSLYYKGTDNFKKFAVTEQVIWLGVLISICFCIFGKKSSGEILISITLIGVSIFLLLFEARSRYLLIFSPLYITLASVGISKISAKIKKAVA